MKKMTLIISVVIAVFILLFALLLILPSRQSDLRGNAPASKDGQTYLAIMDTGGHECTVDEQPWKYKEKEAAPIVPGSHLIDCGMGKIGIEIRPGTHFQFDYWGP